MSRPGITFEIRQESDDAEGQELDSKDLKSPESQKALELLQSRLLVTDPTSGQLEPLEIEQVETYDQGLDTRYAKAFDAKKREPGTLFVVKFRGTALINVVVDPAKRSVIYIKEVSTPKSESRSLASNLKRLLGDNFPDRLDGARLDTPDLTDVELAPKGPGKGILDITAKVRNATGKSTSEHRIIATER